MNKRARRFPGSIPRDQARSNLLASHVLTQYNQSNASLPLSSASDSDPELPRLAAFPFAVSTRSSDNIRKSFSSVYFFSIKSSNRALHDGGHCIFELNGLRIVSWSDREMPSSSMVLRHSFFSFEHVSSPTP